MTIITMANSKGGVGKSTLCVLIATELAAVGNSVLIIDADQKQHSCLQWYDRCQASGTLPEGLMVVSANSPAELHKELKAATADIVMIDVQGSLNDVLVAAIVASDITLVPAKANVIEMVETVKLFEWAQKTLKRAPLKMLLNRVEGIDGKTVAFQDAIKMVREHKVPTLSTFVRARKVYEQFLNNTGSLSQIAQDPSKAEQVVKARNNIIDVISDISGIIGKAA